MKNITLAQSLILIACMAGTFAAYKFMGENAAGVVAMISMVWTFLMGRPKDPPAPPGSDDVSGPSKPAVGFVAGGVLCLAFAVACTHILTPAEAADLAGTAAQIEKCKAEGRACKADGGFGCYDVYDRCMKDAGLHE